MTTTYYYVSLFWNNRTEWCKVGSDPYLDTINYPTDYIFTGEDCYGETGDYEFWDSGAENSEIIDSVAIEIYKFDFLNSPMSVTCYVWNGTSWVNVGTFAISNNVWSWKSIDVSSVLDTWAKIDGAKVYFLSTLRPDRLTMFDCARITVVSHAAVVPIASKRLLVGVGL